MKYKKASWKDVTGTSLKGEVDCSYQDLIDAFGQPHERDGDKTQVEWLFKFEDGTVATVYDYRMEGTPPEKIRDWHIGGSSKKAYFYVSTILFKNYRDLIRKAFSRERVL